jgi:hypothetical protein
MKALSGYGEWFWLLAKGWKDVENRDWSLFRYIKPSELPVRIYLHASKTPASHESRIYQNSMKFTKLIGINTEVQLLEKLQSSDNAKRVNLHGVKKSVRGSLVNLVFG